MSLVSRSDLAFRVGYMHVTCLRTFPKFSTPLVGLLVVIQKGLKNISFNVIIFFVAAIILNCLKRKTQFVYCFQSKLN